MSPILSSRLWDPGATSDEFSQQWTEPGDVFSVLLLLGGDVVGRALAQLAGSRLTPVAFSFGWVAYAVTALVSAVGENKLMPAVETPCQVINGHTGYVRANASWVIGRLVRDFDSWMDGAIRTRLDQILDARWTQGRADAEAKRPGSGATVTRPLKAGLCISVYKAEPARPGCPSFDGPYVTGLLTPFAQLAIAAAPLGVNGDWAVLFVTAAGTALALATGSLSQWAREKWSCRTHSTKTIVLTHGNGSQHAIVVLGGGVGLDLEDLAQGGTDVTYRASLRTRWAVAALAALWVALLVTAAGIRENTRYLVAVGALGILQNIYAAGARRSPAALGVPLQFEAVIAEARAMDALFEAERRYPNLGRSMLHTFFPGRLREDEKLRWSEFEKAAEAKEAEPEKASSST